MARTSTVLALVGISVVASLATYAVYFDYKRRNDVAFRKQLSQLFSATAFVLDSQPRPSSAERQHKKVDKSVKLSASSSSGEASASPYDLKAALEEIRSEPLPSTVEAREKYFLDQLAVGEALIARGNPPFIYASLHTACS